MPAQRRSPWANRPSTPATSCRCATAAAAAIPPAPAPDAGFRTGLPSPALARGAITTVRAGAAAFRTDDAPAASCRSEAEPPHDLISGFELTAWIAHCAIHAAVRLR